MASTADVPVEESVKNVVQSILRLHEITSLSLEQLTARCDIYHKLIAKIKQLLIEANPELSKPDKKAKQLAAAAICVGYDDTFLQNSDISDFFSNISADNEDVNYLQFMELIFGRIFAENLGNNKIGHIANNAYYFAKKRKNYYKVLKKSNLLAKLKIDMNILEKLSERIRNYLKDIRNYPKCQRTMSAFEQFIKEKQREIAQETENIAIGELDAKEIYGRLKTLAQFGPEDSIVAHLSSPYLNEPEFDKRFDPLGEFTEYPYIFDYNRYLIATKEHVSMVIRQRNDDGKEFVCKIMEESFYANHLNNKSFKDDNVQEVMIQRILCEQWDSSPWKFTGPCPYIIALEGVTRGKPRARDKSIRIKHGNCVITHMEPGDEDFIQNMIESYKLHHKPALREWMLNREQRGMTSPWESKRRHEFIQMLLGVLYMHKLGIAHRDLKLDNFTIVKDPDTDEPIVKIIDFGLAIRLHDLHEGRIYNDCVGTPGYQSPECFYSDRRRRRPNDLKLPKDYTYNAEANDVFCLGATLYSMVTGTRTYQYPSNADRKFRFMTSNTFNRGNNHFTETLQRSPDIRSARMVSKNCMTLLKRMLCPEDKRIKLIEMFGHPWIQEGLQQGDFKLNFTLPLKRKTHEMPDLNIKNIEKFKTNEKSINQIIKGISNMRLKQNRPELITEDVISTIEKNGFTPEECVRIYMNNSKIVPDNDNKLFLNNTSSTITWDDFDETPEIQLHDEARLFGTMLNAERNVELAQRAKSSESVPRLWELLTDEQRDHVRTLIIKNQKLLHLVQNETGWTIDDCEQVRDYLLVDKQQKSKEEKGPENWTSMELDEKLEICGDLGNYSSFSALNTLMEDHSFSEEEAREIICTPLVRTLPLFYAKLEPEEREDLENEIKHFDPTEHERSMTEFLVDLVLEMDFDVDTRKMKDLLEWLKEFKSVYSCPEWYFILREDERESMLEMITNLENQTPLRSLIQLIADRLRNLIQPMPTHGDILDFLHWIANLEEEMQYLLLKPQVIAEAAQVVFRRAPRVYRMTMNTTHIAGEPGNTSRTITWNDFDETPEIQLHDEARIFGTMLNTERNVEVAQRANSSTIREAGRAVFENETQMDRIMPVAGETESTPRCYKILNEKQKNFMKSVVEGMTIKNREWLVKVQDETGWSMTDCEAFVDWYLVSNEDEESDTEE